MVDDVWMVSEGNPFVVVESMQAIRDEARDSGRFGSPLARSVQDFVAARLDGSGKGHAIWWRRRPSSEGTSRSRSWLVGPGSEHEAAETVEDLVAVVRWHGWRPAGVFARLDPRCPDDRLFPAARPTLHAAVGDALEGLHRGRLDDVADQLGHHYSRRGFRKASHLVRFVRAGGERYALEEASERSRRIATVEQLPASKTKCAPSSSAS